ncbi:UDP-N-acetylmuramate: L-alanyl-gamma-D-glutamyl-meso-diaminopimelate ligase [Bathymodiolus japonicus methanotrophic gill symbiont]|uniref:UDP-N-acetylmuramate:L-alanyl-gamma-D-glutamyl- meso-diaminopimelate ligase n=1 Tax=Bathymodiolus japonicus methanotrophic gill symbiont TaxID=113269 RepID=UPI001B432685|nr:UDP-N-acetylmuramate:L-alanyl-gamma-D-glutamyl-meso-diaminopimelate ligase [Bathymodiolus japonicus methanotrophic gill symbiont]GFO72316.1 UDP-N-acetylmuramate: L-alanyl-gamma-D-glutamyl-meso-diaminopimelate ligase [Bathymodiolus japonicus methanotrophic gill symbiont]
MHIHILGICGTFMGGLALIARELGHTVSGSDQNVYPPMSTQLAEQGIQLMQGYKAENLEIKPDLVVIGNAMSRGNPEVEAVLNLGLKYTSGPQWLAEYVLQGKWVLAVAGTHGKTTTSSMLAWILEYQGFNPGFLIGGIPMNFGISARSGSSDFFVIEADEYDSAFFDKRSKFVHYRPRTTVLNNLEFDHADIFDDLDAIKRQFHHLIRTVPGEGLIICPAADANIQDTLAMGCWTPVQLTAINQDAAWQVELLEDDGSQFVIKFNQQTQGQVVWQLTGQHNVYNALAAIASARHIGILPADAIAALTRFKNVKRRMEVIAEIKGVTVYDDFAHHPTAIQMTLEGLRKHVGAEKIIAVVDPRSNTMRMGVHREVLAESLMLADRTLIYQPEELDWDLTALQTAENNIKICTSIDAIMHELQQEVAPNSHFLMMSNGSFGGIYQRLQAEL